MSARSDAAAMQASARLWRERAERAEAALVVREQARVDALDKLRWSAQDRAWDIETAQSEAHLRTVAHELIMTRLAEANLERDAAIARAEALSGQLDAARMRAGRAEATLKDLGGVSS